MNYYDLYRLIKTNDIIKFKEFLDTYKFSEQLLNNTTLQAILYKKYKIIKILASKYINLEHISMAIELDELRIIDIFWKKNPNCIKKSAFLIDAISRKNIKIANYLISKGAPINEEYQNYTPLETAICIQSRNIFLTLIAAGADVNHINTKDGGTPLARAAIHGNYPALNVLLKCGADPEIETAGLIPLEWAIENNQKKCIKILKNLHNA